MKKHRVSTGVEIAYYDSGAGRPLVLLHSFGHNKNMWFPQLTYFLERGFRVVAPDMPGHGDSTFDPAHHSVDQIAAFVCRAAHVDRRAAGNRGRYLHGRLRRVADVGAQVAI